MLHMVGIGKVKDFDQWYAGFSSEEGVEFRKRAGMKSWQVFRSVDDPNRFVIAIEWDSLENVRKFEQAAETQEKKQQSGVLESQVYILEQVEKVTV